MRARRVLANLAKTCVARGLNLALLDARDLYATLKLSEMYAAARAFHEMGFEQDHRLAVLHRYNSTERAEFFAMCANDQGFEVGAFDNYEDAMEWLNRPRTEVMIRIR